MRFLKWLGSGLLVLVALIGLVAVVGLMLPQGHIASRTVIINRPAMDVWRTLTRPEDFPSWRRSVTRVEVLGRDPLRWREDGSDGPLALQVIESREPFRLVTEIADKDLPFGGRWAYDLKQADQGSAGPTELTITEHGEVYNPVFRFVSRFVIGHTATIDAYLTDLQKKLS